MAEMDYRVGQNLVHPDALDIRNTTLVIFAFDNGPEFGAPY